MGDDALGPQRRTRHSFLLNSEMADMVHNLFCWAPVELAVLKPERVIPTVCQIQLIVGNRMEERVNLTFIMLEVPSCALA